MNLEDLAALAESDLNAVRAVMDALPAPVYIKDIQGRYIECNQAFIDLFGRASSNEIIGKTLVDLSDHDTAADLHQRDLVLLKNPGCRVDEIDASDMLDKRIILHLHGCTTNDKFGEVSGIVGLIFDITARAELESKLEKLSQIDDLTRIPNRRHGMSRLEDMISHSKRHNFECCLLMLDIDHFKRINDEHGHRAGDIVLEQVSGLLSMMARTSDTVFRYGGEEFVFLLPNTSKEGAEVFAERIRIAMNGNPFSISTKQAVSCSISIGVACYPMHADSASELLNVADQALYQAKGEGRNRVVVFSSQTAQ